MEYPRERMRYVIASKHTYLAVASQLLPTGGQLQLTAVGQPTLHYDE